MGSEIHHKRKTFKRKIMATADFCPKCNRPCCKVHGIWWTLNSGENPDQRNSAYSVTSSRGALVDVVAFLPIFGTVSNHSATKWVSSAGITKNIAHARYTGDLGYVYGRYLGPIMADRKHGTLPSELQDLLVFNSSPTLLTSAAERVSRSHSSIVSKSQHENIYRHFVHNGRPASASVYSKDYEYSNLNDPEFTFPNVARSDSVHSWHGRANRQPPSDVRGTHIHDSVSFRISSILKSLRSLSAKRNLLPFPRDQPKSSINSVYLHSQNGPSILKGSEVTCSKTENDATFTPGIDLSVSIDCDAYSQLPETVISQTAGNKPKTSGKSSPEPLSKIWLLLGIAANLLFIGPLVVVFWNSTWNLCDRLLFSNSCQGTVWASAGIGFSIIVTVTLLQDVLLSFSARCNTPVRYIVTRVYTYVVSIGCVNQWRGVWLFSDCYIGNSLLNSCLSFGVPSFILLVLRCYRSVPAPPVYVALELPHSLHYKVATFRGSPPTRSVCFLLDALFTAAIVQTLMITCWRGLWEMMDKLLFPDDPQSSAIWSVGISFVLSVALLSLHMFIKKLSIYLHGTNWFLLLVFEDTITVLYSVVCISNWRGIWMLLNLYLPEPSISLYVAHGASFVILALGLTANSILVRGVQRDCSSLERCGVIFDMSYVNTLVQECRARKEMKISLEDTPYSSDDPKTINMR